MTTQSEERIVKKLDALGNEICSKDLGDLEPKTTREYLMIMWPTQRAMLRHLESLNGFRMDISQRVRFLEAAWKVGGAIIVVSLLGLALSRFFG